MTPDELRLEDLAGKAGPRVLAYLARRTSPPDAVADIYQQVLLTTWTRIARVPEEPDAALCWMLATARRHLANHARGQRRRLGGTERLARSIRVMQPPSPFEHEPLDNALRGLNADDLELVRLVYWDDLTTTQVAAVLGIQPATVRKRLQRSRQQLRLALADAQSMEPKDGIPILPSHR